MTAIEEYAKPPEVSVYPVEVNPSLSANRCDKCESRLPSDKRTEPPNGTDPRDHTGSAICSECSNSWEGNRTGAGLGRYRLRFALTRRGVWAKENPAYDTPGPDTGRWICGNCKRKCRGLELYSGCVRCVNCGYCMACSKRDVGRGY